MPAITKSTKVPAVAGSTHLNNLDTVPLDGAPRRRVRVRRGGPRTPLPLVAAIAVAGGIAIAYVSQTAHATQANYQLGSLESEQAALRSQNDQLGEDLGRLGSAERVVAAAQGFGMRPAGSWVYVAASPVDVVPRPGALAGRHIQADNTGDRLLAALSGVFGPRENGASPR